MYVRRWGSQAAWPDVEIKSIQTFPKIAKKLVTTFFYYEVMFFKIAQKWPYILAGFVA